MDTFAIFALGFFIGIIIGFSRKVLTTTTPESRAIDQEHNKEQEKIIVKHTQELIRLNQEYDNLRIKFQSKYN